MFRGGGGTAGACAEWRAGTRAWAAGPALAPRMSLPLLAVVASVLLESWNIKTVCDNFKVKTLFQVNKITVLKYNITNHWRNFVVLWHYLVVLKTLVVWFGMK